MSRNRSGRAAFPGSVRAGSGGADDRRGWHLRRVPAASWPWASTSTGTSTRWGAGGGLHGERHVGHRPVGGPARARPGRHPPDAGRPRRVQGPAQGGARRARPTRSSNAANSHKIRNVKDHLPQRLRANVGRKMTDAYHALSALEAETALLALANGARPRPSRRGGQPARGPRRDAHGLAVGCAAHPGSHAALDERHRVDDLHQSRSCPQRQTLARRADERCAGAPPAWSRPASNSAASTVTCTYRHFAPPSNASPLNLSDPCVHAMIR